MIKRYITAHFLLTGSFSIILALLMLPSLQAQGQKSIHHVNAEGGDSLVIRLNDYVGNIQWQSSPDMTAWAIIPDALADTLLFVADTTTYFRAEVVAGDCDPFYSDTVFVEVSPSASYFPCGEIYTDARDGNTYATIQAADQCWMRENLRFLPSVSPSAEASLTNPLYYVYDFQEPDVEQAILDENYINYGALYNWPAAVDACPAGWHLPDNEDWEALKNYLLDNNDDISPSNLANALKSCRQVNSPLGGECDTEEHPRWNAHSTHHGTDEIDFTALPAGARELGGTFAFKGMYADFWSATEHNSLNAWGWGIYFFDGNLYNYNNGNKGYGFSIRCVRAAEE